MLVGLRHWHIASKRSPEQESRLLAFAAPGANPPNTPQGGPNAQNQPANPSIPSVNPSPAINQQSTDTQERVHRTITDADAAAIGAAFVSAQKAAEKAKETQEIEEDRKNAATAKKEAMKRQLENVRNGASELKGAFEKEALRMRDKDIVETMEKHGTGEQKSSWENNIHILEREATLASLDGLFADDLLEFHDDLRNPKEFIDRITLYYQAFDAKIAPGIAGPITRELNDALARCQARYGDMTRWETLNEDTKIAIRDELKTAVQTSKWIETVQAMQSKMRKEVLELQQKRTDEVEKYARESVMMEISKLNDREGGLLMAIASIRFRSVMDYVGAVKTAWESVKKVWGQRTERNIADIAGAIGRNLRGVPVVGEEVHRILDQNLENKRSEEAKEMKDDLERQNANWLNVFDEQSGIFWQFAGKNPNKTRGILEYAADHGWLYDLDEDVSNNNHPIYGLSLNTLCGDWATAGDTNKISNYYSKLRGANAAGRDKEISAGKEKEHDVENVPRFIEVLRGELGECNLWSSVGICTRAMERGLLGEVSPWLLTTVMDELNHNPQLRKFAPVSFFDKIGQIAMYNSAFSLGLMKLERKELARWAKTGDKRYLEGMSISMLPGMADDIKRLDPTTDYNSAEGRLKMNRTLAKVLACQIVTLPGGYIHIYQNQYKHYRKRAEDNINSLADPFKEDSDFMTGTTEKPMLHEVPFKQVLKYQSTFEFTNEGHARAFMDSIIRTARELKAIPALADAYQNYVQEIRVKFDKNFGAYTKEDRASKQLSVYLSDDRTPAIAALVAEGLISIDIMKNAKYFKDLKPQLAEHFPDFFAKHYGNESAPNAANASSSSA